MDSPPESLRWIYTGGLDRCCGGLFPVCKLLISSPHRVDLTPFAGLLSNGQPHEIAVSVFNANNGFSTTATLWLFEDRDSKVVTGEVTQNTIDEPNPNVVENLTTDSSGNITGPVTVTSTRQFVVEGFVRSSHGRVETKVEQDINLSNIQNFSITSTAFVQNITQRTNICSETQTRVGNDDSRVSSSVQRFEWPLDLAFAFTVNLTARARRPQPSNSSA